MLRNSIQHRTAAHAREGVLDVKLHPRPVGVRLGHHLNGVRQDFCASWSPSSELMGAHCFEQGGLVLPHQRPGGQLSQAFPPGNRPDAAIILKKWR